MFDRFTEPVKRALIGAEAEVRALGHEQVETGHLLLALLGETDCVASRVLAALRVPVADVREQVEGSTDRGRRHAGGPVAFTEESKRALLFAGQESLRLGHGHIGTEHVLLGMIAVDGVAARLLAKHGVGFDDVRALAVRG